MTHSTELIRGRAANARFGPGDPGRPKGARHKSTLAAEALLDGQTAALTQKAVDMASNMTEHAFDETEGFQKISSKSGVHRWAG